MLGPLHITKIFKLVAVVLMSVIACGCVGYRSFSKEQIREEYRPKLHQIQPANGIDQREAEVIAEAYFFRFNPMKNGCLSPVYDGEQEWITETAIGNTIIKHTFSSEAPVKETKEPIRINKQTGRVNWSEGPTIDDPRTVDN